MTWAVAITSLPADAMARPVFEQTALWARSFGERPGANRAKMPRQPLVLCTTGDARIRQSNQPKGNLEKSSLGRLALICGPVIEASSTLVGGTSSSQRRTLMHLDIGPLYSRDRYR
jgi:hypothetical protein